MEATGTNVDTRIDINEDQTYKIMPFNWTGKWEIKTGRLELSPGKYYEILELFNGNKRDSSRNPSRFTMEISMKTNEIIWKTRAMTAKYRYVFYVFHRENSKNMQ